jgi:tRNA-splicing ligase RtcB
VQQGYGTKNDLQRIEEDGCIPDPLPREVSRRAKNRQREEMDTLGSGNHYLAVQHVAQIHDRQIAAAFKLQQGDTLLSIHCGSRGLGHQIGTEFLTRMAAAATQYRIELPDRELHAHRSLRRSAKPIWARCARRSIALSPVARLSPTSYARHSRKFFRSPRLPMLYDAWHNTCTTEEHLVHGRKMQIFVHQEGATRAFGPSHPALPVPLQEIGQSVLIGGTMGTASYILCGTPRRHGLALGSACHGEGAV